MALKKKLKAGEEIQARCTKCKKTSAHNIVAMVKDEISKVECIICGSQHKYYPPKEEGEKKAKSTSKAAAKPTARKTRTGEPKPAKLSDEEKRSQIVQTEWRNAVHGVAEDRFKPYILNGVYQENDYLLHPHFGKGKVLKITGIGKLEALFESGVRRLVYNRTTS